MASNHWLQDVLERVVLDGRFDVTVAVSQEAWHGPPRPTPREWIAMLDDSIEKTLFSLLLQMAEHAGDPRNWSNR